MRTLIIEDHPAMIEGYKSILSMADGNIKFQISTALNCGEAFHAITTSKFDLILLDINIPPLANSPYNSGTDIALLIKREMPKCKLLILTSHIEKIILYSLARDVSPNGLMVKSDFSPEDLINGIKKVIEGENVFTQSVVNSVREIGGETIYLDANNRKILQLLAEGVLTKNLIKYLDLSQSAIDKRKVQIKDYLGIFKGSDEEMIREARKSGLI